MSGTPRKHRLKTPALPDLAPGDPIGEAIAATTPDVEGLLKLLSGIGVELAITAPDVRVIGSDHGKVPWSLIERARDACDALGVDWRVMRSQAIALAKGGALVSTDIEQ